MPVANPRSRRGGGLQRDAWHDAAHHAEACTSCTLRAHTGRCCRARAPNRRHPRGRAPDSPWPGDDVRLRRGARRTPAAGPTRGQGVVRSATGQRGTVAASRCGGRTHRLSSGLAHARTADFPAARRRCRCCGRPCGPGPARLGCRRRRPRPVAVVGRMRPRPRYAACESLIMRRMQTGALPG
jgi:hypothetical protein